MGKVVQRCTIVLFMSIAGCSATSAGSSSTSSDVPADPAGTVTTELRIEGNGPNAIDFDTGQVGGQNSNCGSGADGNGPSFNDVRLDRAVNFSTCSPATIISVGSVRGLGAITTIPSSGFGASSAATLGTGYVIKSTGGHVFAVYVAAQITGAGTGSLIGFRLKWVQLQASSDEAGAGPVPSLTATYDGTPICSLGWTSVAPAATGAQSSNTINVNAGCSGGYVDGSYKPIPATGATSPCDHATFRTVGMPDLHCDQADAGSSSPTGTVTLSGSTGSFKISGTCTCTGAGHTATVQFQDLAMSVQ